MVFVIPQFQTLFSSFGGDLPAFTKAVVTMSEWMQSYWWAVVIAVIGSIYLFSYTWKRSRKFRQTIDRMMLGVPIIGGILNKASIARFARTLATMFAARGSTGWRHLESVRWRYRQRRLVVMLLCAWRDGCATGPVPAAQP